jgi:glycosyltransferase involved in cell wall biosynthesis
MLIINDNYSQTFHYQHPQIRIFNFKEKFSTIGEKRNFGLKNALGDLILQLDDDDLLLPTYLDNLKKAIGDNGWLCAQKPIMYYDNSDKVILCPTPQYNTFLYRRQPIIGGIEYDTVNYDELTPFYNKVTQRSRINGIYRQLKPHEYGYVYRQDINEDKRYKMSDFKKESLDIQNQILLGLKDSSGDITLKPKWNKDYTSIIKKNLITVSIPDNLKQPKFDELISAAKKESETWNVVKPTWTSALKFLNAVKSRGILSTTLDVIGINDTFGNRVSDEIYKQRRLSCFGDKNNGINPCYRLTHTPNRGYFCGGCGCGNNDLAKLDGDTPDEYTKLHYPQLECPLKRTGFSNESHEIPLSVVIPVVNDNEELNLTIKSIRETSPQNVEIIVVDDFSDVPVKIEDSTVKLIRREERIGAGNSKHVGVEVAKSKHILIIDSHMRFVLGWFEEAMKLVPNSPKTLWCTVCLGLNESNMDCSKAKGSYYGADLILYEPEKKRVFQGVWTNRKPGENYEVSCVMGACYFVHKDYFLSIGGTKDHKKWGSLEPLLSLKYWLSGGEVRVMTNAKIGHKFREKSPYLPDIKCIEYNKIRPLKTFLPDDLYNCLLDKIPASKSKTEALQMIETDKHEIEKDKQTYRNMFVHDIYWFMNKFGIKKSL